MIYLKHVLCLMCWSFAAFGRFPLVSEVPRQKVLDSLKLFDNFLSTVGSHARRNLKLREVLMLAVQPLPLTRLWRSTWQRRTMVWLQKVHLHCYWGDGATVNVTVSWRCFLTVWNTDEDVLENTIRFETSSLLIKWVLFCSLRVHFPIRGVVGVFVGYPP